MGLFLGSLFGSIDLCIYFCANTLDVIIVALWFIFKAIQLLYNVTLVSSIQWSESSISSVQLSHVRLCATPWIPAHQASLSITNSWSLFKLMSIESVMPSNHLILCCSILLPPSIFPSIRIFSNESVLHIQSIGVSASTSVLPMNIQDWFPLGLTGWISL